VSCRLKVNFRAFVFKIKRRISALRNLIEYLIEARLWHSFLSETELSQIRRVITSILNLYTKQSMNGTLSKKQKEMMNVFTEIETLFHETNLCNKPNQKTFSVWKLLQAERNIIEDLEKRIFSFKDLGLNDIKQIVYYILLIKHKEQYC